MCALPRPRPPAPILTVPPHPSRSQVGDYVRLKEGHEKEYGYSYRGSDEDEMVRALI